MPVHGEPVDLHALLAFGVREEDMTKPASYFEPGDVLDYTPHKRWCHEGIAIVQDDGRAIDTYWSYQPGVLTDSELATAKLRFRLGDVREVGSRDEWETYAPVDRHAISAQHGYQWALYVRAGAEPDLSIKIVNARAAVERAEGALDTAKWHLARRRKELAALETS